LRPNLLVVGVVVGIAASACTDSRPADFWTVEEAETIRTIRGTTLQATECKGIGQSRSSGYRRFSCIGETTPKALPELPVRVTYVLNTRGEYREERSAYLATDVHFDAFGVP
jgi:hypothetical protein